MNAITYTLLFMYVFWNLYVYSMGLYRAKLQGRLVGLSLVMALPVVAITFILDVLIQFTVASLVFWQCPQAIAVGNRLIQVNGRAVNIPWPTGDWFLTHRLRRYILAGESMGWRYRWAAYICKYLADPFDPTGAHCDSDEPVLNENGHV